MRVTRNTHDHLVLDGSPWLLGGFMAVLIVVSAACLAFLPFNGHPEGLIALPFLIGTTTLFKGIARRDQAVFDRTQGMLVLRHRTLTNYASETIPLSQISGAEVKVTKTKRRPSRRTRRGEVRRRGSKEMYCPAVRINGKLRALTNLSTNGGRHERNVETINNWLTMQPNRGVA